MQLWPHQQRALDELAAKPRTSVCVCSPTGAGKTVIMIELLKHGHRAVLYTNRRMLLEQTAMRLQQAGLSFGIRAAGYEPDPTQPIQLASIQTDNSRVLERDLWSLHDAELVLIDEAHINKEATAIELVRRYREAGAIIVGFTATLLGIGHIYDEMVVAGTVSELQAAGILVRANHYAPDEPDTRKLKRTKTGEYKQADVVKAIMTHSIFGRVVEHWRALNEAEESTLLFAPGVKESIWFAEQLTAAGIPAAHIDGNDVWLRGKSYRSDQAARDDLRAMAESGEVKIVCNRFVLREGIDWPFIRHMVFATIFGSLTSYLQSGGRGLRSHPGKTHVTVQDHGGCLDSQTEILTPRGWAGRTEIVDSDMVAAFDAITGEISWQPILSRHDRPLEVGEKMFSASGKQVDIRVTGNHKIVFKKRTCLADGSPVWPETFKLERADVLAESKVRFKIPISGLQRSTGLSLTDDEIKFIGWFITDGTMAGKRRQVSISQGDHQTQISDLRSCLRGCGFDFTERKQQSSYFSGSKPVTVFAIPKGTCKSRPRHGWIALEPYLDKSLSPLLEGLNQRQFEVLLHAIHLGDGAKGVTAGRYSISTGCRVFADRLQGMCVRRGFKCNISTRKTKRINDLFVLHISQSDHVIVHGKYFVEGQTTLAETESHPGERVWCVKNSLGTLVTRRNGKVAIIGNSWWRHGSLNADREWHLDRTDYVVCEAREERLRTRKEPEPISCPKCYAIRLSGPVCMNCGYRHTERSRMVVQLDGRLKEVQGDIFKPRREYRKPDVAERWERYYWRARNADMTFNQARGLFAYENNWKWPPAGLPYMPKDELDWFRSVKDVPRHRLTAAEQSVRHDEPASQLDREYQAIVRS